MDLKKLMQKPFVAVDDMSNEFSQEAVRHSSLARARARSLYALAQTRLSGAARLRTPTFLRSRPRNTPPLTLPSPPPPPQVEIVTSCVDKFLATENYEKAAQAVKEGMDKKFGPTWHVCVGEGFGYDVTYNARNMIMVYYGEKIGILCFKC